MIIYIEANNGEVLEFEVGSNSTVLEFKQLVEKDERIKKRGNFKIKDLPENEHMPLSSSGIGNGSTVFMNFSEAVTIPSLGYFMFYFVPTVITAGIFFGVGHSLSVKVLRKFSVLLSYATS